MFRKLRTGQAGSVEMVLCSSQRWNFCLNCKNCCILGVFEHFLNSVELSSDTVLTQSRGKERVKTFNAK